MAWVGWQSGLRWRFASGWARRRCRRRPATRARALCRPPHRPAGPTTRCGWRRPWWPGPNMPAGPSRWWTRGGRNCWCSTVQAGWWAARLHCWAVRWAMPRCPAWACAPSKAGCAPTTAPRLRAASSASRGATATARRWSGSTTTRRWPSTACAAAPTTLAATAAWPAATRWHAGCRPVAWWCPGPSTTAWCSRCWAASAAWCW